MVCSRWPIGLAAMSLGHSTGDSVCDGGGLHQFYKTTMMMDQASTKETPVQSKYLYNRGRYSKYKLHHGQYRTTFGPITTYSISIYDIGR
jgi:hypothetical protein